MGKTNLEIAQEFQEKIELYFVALTFTIAGFAIQSGKFSGWPLGDSLEALSWISFFVSGIVAMSRFEYIPVARRLYDKTEKRRIELDNYETNPDYVTSVNKGRKRLNSEVSKRVQIEKTLDRKYLWQKIFFIAGLIFLLCARILYQLKETYKLF